MELDPDTLPADETSDLIWALLDEQISDSEFRRLEELLRSDESVRRLYVECVQLHVDLAQWFAGKDESVKAVPVGLPLDLPALTGDSSTFAAPPLGGM